MTPDQNPLHLLKAALADTLEKKGSSLLELEESLANLHIERHVKRATHLLKLAGEESKSFGNPAFKALKWGGGAALGLGALGALGLDSLDKDVQMDQGKHQLTQSKIRVLKKLTEKVRQENTPGVNF